MNVSKNIWLVVLVVVLLVACKLRQSNTESKGQSETPARSNPVIKPSVALQDKREKPHAGHSPHMRKLGTRLFNAYHKAYNKAYNSVEGCEKFIGQYPDERDLCAGALLRIAQLYGRQGQRERAIETYQKAIDEYGEEIVPYVCTTFRVKDCALLRIGLLYKDMGLRDKAMKIFCNLTNEAQDSNTRRSARIHYLETKQSHLKIKVKISLPVDKWIRTYEAGNEVPVSMVIKNNTMESVTFVPHVRMCTTKMRNPRFASRRGSKELTLQPGEKYEQSYVFTLKDAGLGPGKYKVMGDLTGIPFSTNSVMLKLIDEK